MVHQNSIEAYKSLPLTRRQQEVVDAISLSAFRARTDAEIAEHLGYTVNRVTGRLTELIEKGVVEECGSVTGSFGKRVRITRLKNEY